MSNPTQKQQLEQAEAKITDLQTKIDAATGLQTKLDEATRNLSAAETARDGFKTRAEDAEGKLTAATARADKAETDLKAANAEVATLKAGKKTTDGAAAEQLAARGVNPQAADENAITGNGEDIQAIADQFMKASMTEKRNMLAKHGEKLRAHVANQARKG